MDLQVRNPVLGTTAFIAWSPKSASTRIHSPCGIQGHIRQLFLAWCHGSLCHVSGRL